MCNWSLTLSGLGSLHFSTEGLMVKMESLQDCDQQTGVGKVKHRKERESSESFGTSSLQNALTNHVNVEVQADKPT